MKKNILITGAGGFVGKNLAKFLESEYNLIKLSIEEADLSDKKSVEDYAENLKESLSSAKSELYGILHLAFKLADAGQSLENQFENFNINVNIAKNFVMLAEILKPKKILNFSSMAVYPNTDGEFSENSQIKTSDNSDCMYGLAKFCQENIIDYNLKNSALITHFRIAQVYGDGMRQDRIMPVMKQELQKNNEITVFGEGERVSCFISIEELEKIVKAFLDNDAEGIYNVGDLNISFYDLAEKIIEKYGNKDSKIILKENGSRTKFYLNCDKLKNKLKDWGGRDVEKPALSI